MSRTCCAAMCALACAALSGCGKKDSDPVSAPLPLLPSAGDRLSTGVGAGRALETDVAPSAMKPSRFVVADDKHVALIAEVAGESIFLMTPDGGKSWRSLRTEAKDWWSWSLAADGSAALATGTREPARGRAAGGAITSARVQIAPAGEPLGGAAPIFPQPPALARARITGDGAAPALLSGSVAAFVLEESPRRGAIAYHGAGAQAGEGPARLPAGEAVSPVPAGRPPALVSVRGRDVLVRPFPAPGEAPAPPVRVDGLIAGPTTTAELSAPPACETSELSYFALSQGGGKVALLAASAGRTAVMRLPDGATAKPGTIGCGATRVTAWLGAPGSTTASLATCTLDGAPCVVSKTPPFRPWEGLPDASASGVESRATAVGQGIIAVRSSRAGDRWAIHMSQSQDGAVFELPRVVAEGSGDRGRVELGTLASLGARALLFVAGDVTGTSRRAWYVMASDDGGATWSPP